jgi:phosphoribosyl 1,2-cyclic phosphate phosphodiesterase
VVNGKEILLDASPDFRQQSLRYKIGKPDAVFITHTHYDHIGGLEELRAYNFRDPRSIPCYLSRESFENVKKMFYYHFTPRTDKESFVAQFQFQVFHGATGVFYFENMPVHYFTYHQGNMPVSGFRLGGLAYVTDIKEYDSTIVESVKGCDVLVISASRYGRSRTQMTIEEALEFRAKAGARKTYFSHLSHDIEYAKVSALLPSDVQLAYDGLTVEFCAEFS